MLPTKHTKYTKDDSSQTRVFADNPTQSENRWISLQSNFVSFVCFVGTQIRFV